MVATEKKDHSSNRIIGLDIIRTIAILLVVFYHSSKILYPLLKVHVVGSIVGAAIALGIWFGPLGVELFFVLSGFLIGNILIKTYLQPQSFSLTVIKNFWIRRWFRTIPNYFFLLTIGFILFATLYGTHFNILYYFFLQNLAYSHPDFFGEAWSLAVEEWFYLTLPIALLLFSRMNPRREKKETLKYTFIVYLAVFIIIRFIKVALHDYSKFDNDIRKVVVFRLDSVMYGVIIAYLLQFHKQILEKLRSRLLWIGIIGVGMLVLIEYLVTFKSQTLKNSLSFNMLHDSLYPALFPLFFSLCIPSAYFLKSLKSKNWSLFFTHISLISYSLYLIHYTLIYLPFFDTLKDDAHSPSYIIILYYLLYWFLVIVISTINYRLIEKPTTKLREYLSKGE